QAIFYAKHKNQNKNIFFFYRTTIIFNEKISEFSEIRAGSSIAEYLHNKACPQNYYCGHAFYGFSDFGWALRVLGKESVDGRCH
ncbi:MAG: hypothetical protein KBT13_02115, partial [Bacteroidales bacterium]|nr:hypothetical protein [Candidatus Sodaliphilus limicaballi]